jgi:pimeloyl-ACP methyl ester carboxylesterase
MVASLLLFCWSIIFLPFFIPHLIMSSFSTTINTQLSTYKPSTIIAATAAATIAATCLAKKLLSLALFKTGTQSRIANITSRPVLTDDFTSDQRFIQTSVGSVRVSVLRPANNSNQTNNLNLDKNLVIMVHGFASPMEIWQHQAIHLQAQGHTVIRFDLYGRGFSDAPDVPHNVSLFVAQLCEVLTALNITVPFDLVGVSMGGAISTVFSAIYPNKVKRLVLVCPAGAKPPKVIRNIPYLSEIFFNFYGSQFLLKWGTKQWQNPKSAIFEAGVVRHRATVREHLGFLRSLFSTVVHFDYSDFPSYFQAISKHPRPVLIIWGEEDTLLKVEEGRLIQSWLPNSELVVIPNSNHVMTVENPEPINAALADWFKDTQKRLDKLEKSGENESKTYPNLK